MAASVSSSKNMPVDLGEGLLFDASIVESGQLTFNHSFNLFFLISNISSTEILPKSSTSLKLKFAVFT